MSIEQSVLVEFKEPSFESVLGMIYEFINPVFKAITNEDEFYGLWDCKNRKWIS